jgi:DNA-binding MarR family transcriptional regulator
MAVPFPALSDNMTPPASPLFLREHEVRRGVELLFFGYTRLTRSIDEGLARHGLGRAHHRALYFIARQPDLTISDLLKILAITKQSLGRVLTDLVRHGLVETRNGKADRRQKLLRLTADGHEFEAQLFDALRASLAAAYGAAGQDSVTGFWRVLEGLIPPEDRDMVAALQKDIR